MSFQLDPKLPFAAFVNPKIAFTQSKGIDYQYGQMLQSYAGDPAAGQMTGNTTIPWNKTTEVQGLTFEFYAVQGIESSPLAPTLPDDLQQILEANPGPDEFWNYSYEKMGLVPGIPPAFKTLNTVEVGTDRSVTVILP
jgi:hypothetical protein